MTMLRLESVRVDDCGGRWLRPKQLQEKFSMTRTTVWKLLSAMRGTPKYKGDWVCKIFCVNAKASCSKLIYNPY